MSENRAQARPPSPPSGDDPELDALLREQHLLALPLALVSRILEEILPLERVRPLTLLGRGAAAAAVFLAAWFAFAGDAPALADVTPTPRLTAALPASLRADALMPAGLPAARNPASTLAKAAPGDGGAALFLGSGALILLAGLALAVRLHQPAPPAGPPPPATGHPTPPATGHGKHRA